MKPWKTLDRAVAPGGKELLLQERDGQFTIRVDGKELMSSRTHGSEEEMARIALSEQSRAPGSRVLIGGLGLGYTLRAALDLLPSRGRVVVSEVSDAVVKWNRGPLAHLAGAPLEDARVAVEQRDVLAVLEGESTGRFDAILLDVDNGPVALTLSSNATLYGTRGISACRAALEPSGVLVVWSAGPDEAYRSRLERGGFTAQMRNVTAHGRRHTLFVGKASRGPSKGTRR